VRIVKSTRSRGCVDGALMKEYMLDEPLSEAFLKFLEQFGTVRYLDQMKRPFFSFDKEHFISVKGFVGDDMVEVRYKKEGRDLVMDYFHLLLFYAQEGESGIRILKGIEESIWKKMEIRLVSSVGDGT
jgi:hypothetical protein